MLSPLYQRGDKGVSIRLLSALIEYIMLGEVLNVKFSLSSRLTKVPTKKPAKSSQKSYVLFMNKSFLNKCIK